MQVKERSFWSTTSGLVTGLAGLLTAVVGLVTVAVQLGWLGSDDGGDKEPAANSAASTTLGTGPAGTTGTTSRGLTGGATATTSGSTRTPLSANPANVTLDAIGSKERVVTISNGGSSSIPLRTPTIEGVDSNQFSISNVTCGSRLDVNRTCEVKVTYQATRAGQASAKLVIQPTDSTPALEVPLSGNRLL